MPLACSLSEKTENHIVVFFKSLCSRSATVSIYVLRTHYSNSQFNQKPHKCYKCSLLPLVLAINQSIYFLFNATFNQAYDVNHLIKRLLLMLQRYMTRCNDFKCRWFVLLLSGLL